MVLVRALETLASLGLLSVATTLITQQDYAAQQIWPTGQWYAAESAAQMTMTMTMMVMY